MRRSFDLFLSFLVGCWLIAAALAPVANGDDRAEFARKLQNPIAYLSVVPFQNDFHEDIGVQNEGHQYELKIQPVIPVPLSPTWNLLHRLTLPLVSNHNVLGNYQTGFGDMQYSAFFSPTPAKTGENWGVGPAFQFPTATEDALGAKKWATGPTGIALVQEGPMTYGILLRQLWSVAGSSDRPSISQFYFQPFFAMTDETALTLALSIEDTHDWRSDQNLGYAIFTGSQVLRWGTQTVSVGGGFKWGFDGPAEAKADWGLRATVAFIFAD